MWFSNDPTEVMAELVVFAANRSPQELIDDDPAFQALNDQETDCDPSFQEAFRYEWSVGEFVPCETTDCTRIFFQYLPRLRTADGSDTAFWAGVSFVNHGTEDLDEVKGAFYEADGALWNVDFPALPVRNQQTWGIWFNDTVGTVVLEDTEGVLEPLIPSSTTDLIFGDQRSSLFIQGCAIVENDLSSDLGVDLDGYLLLGAGDIINGSYAARNFEITASGDRDPFQDGDLPVNDADFNKRGAIEYSNPFDRGILKVDILKDILQ